LLLQKNDHLKTTYYAVGSLLLLLLVISTLFAFHFRKKTLQHTETLEEQALFLEKTRQEKLKRNIQNIENASFLESLLSKIDQLKKNRVITSEHLDGIGKLIKERKHNRADMEELAIHVDSLNTKFSQRLLNAFPNLTPNEIRHCCLIRVQLSTKEISRILHVDPRSIQTARYRIKKKLQLEEAQDLLPFLIKY
jgi:DNA-binding CsgD family transcriptional regulator